MRKPIQDQDQDQQPTIGEAWADLRAEWQRLKTNIRRLANPAYRAELVAAEERYQRYRSGDATRADADDLRHLAELHAVALDMMALREGQLAGIVRVMRADSKLARPVRYTMADAEYVAGEVLRWHDLASRMNGELAAIDPPHHRIAQLIRDAQRKEASGE